MFLLFHGVGVKDKDVKTTLSSGNLWFEASYTCIVFNIQQGATPKNQKTFRLLNIFFSVLDDVTGSGRS